MSRNISKKIITLFLIVSMFGTGFDSAFFSLVLESILNNNHGNIVDKIYLAKQNSNVVDNFKFGVKSARAAEDPNELEYAVDVGPVSGTATANYVYASFFNPGASGRVAVIKSIAIRANAVAAANYVNLSLRRITTASAGTQLAAADIPKKHTDSVNPVTEVRYAGVTVSFSGVTNSRIMGQPMPGAAGDFNSYRDITFGANDEKLILQAGEGIALYQEAAGDTDQRVRIYVEWEEVVSGPSAQSEFLFAFPRVENAAAANYVYNSFFNPAASGKTAIVKRVWLGSESCDAAAVYTNNIVLRRISAASAGTAITASDVPKKHTASANSVMDFRTTGASVTVVGGTDARLGHVTPCGAAGQPHGWMEINFQANDEKLILQQGEGIALMADAAGDVDQIVRMIIEWQEVASGSTPASQGEYIWASPRIEVAAALNTTFYTFFNPVASGKTAVIKKIAVRNNADAAATYSAFQFRRISTASGGTLVAASDLPKKHNGTANAVTEVRWCGAACGTAITTTYSGTTDSDLMQINGPGAVGQVSGQREIAFGGNEKLVLQQGEGIGFYIDVLAGDVDQYVKILIEWDEETAAPSSLGEYLIDIGPVNGSTAANYVYASFFNPAASGKTAVVKRVSVRIDAVAAALYIPATLRRITSASAGTQITAANIPKKHTSTANSAMDIRRTGVTAGLAGTIDSRLTGVQTPGTVGSAVAPAITGYKEILFSVDERIILQQGEGIALYQEAAGDADFRVKLLIEWEEVASGSTPASVGEYLMTAGPSTLTSTSTSNFVYASLFNPAASGKNYVVKRIGIRANRSGTAIAPSYIPATIRKITAASAGTQITAVNIPKKHTGTADTTAEIRYTGVTVTFAGVTASRFLGATVPGAVNQFSGDFESEIVFGDELILKAGEGLALYQEGLAGDLLVRFRFNFEWKEVTSGGANTLTIGVTAGSKVSAINSGDSSVYANATSCSAPASCAALTLNVSNTSVTVSSIKITETGTANATSDLSQLALFYDTDGNYSNGVTGQYGATVVSFTAEAATVSGSLALTPATTYYFYIRFNASSTTSYPKGGQTVNFQIAANGDVTLSSGSATITGAPVSMAGTTTILPKVSSVSYGSGLSDGARSSEAITVSGYGFGVAPGGSRANCAGAVDTGCVRFLVGGAATVADSSVSSWSNTSIGWTVSSTLATLGGASSLELVSGAQGTATDTTYYIYPNITVLSATAAREYDFGDTDGLVMLQGDHFGSVQGTVSSTGAFGNGNLSIHSIAEGGCTTGGWSASGYSGNSVCVEITSSSIPDNVYLGSITLNRNSDLKTDIESNFGIMPRIISNTPANGVVADVIQILGNHFCQSGTCPVSPNRSDASNNVKFGNTTSTDADFVNQSGGGGVCNGGGAAWTNTEICVKVPSGVPTGSQPTKVRTNATYDSNTKAFTVNSTVPNDPTDLNQYKENGATVIPAGGATASSTVVLKATSTASLSINMLLQVEIEATSTAFDGIGIIDGPICAGCTSTSTAVKVTGLSDGDKHWRARTKNNSTGETSNWVYYGTSDINEIDFKIDTVAPTITFTPTDTCSGGQSGLSTNQATINWNLNEQANGQLEYSVNSDLSGSTNYPIPPNATSTSHQITLSNLNSNTTYYYKAKSQDNAGNLANRPSAQPYCSFLTYSVIQPAKTTTFFVIGATSTISGGNTATSSFSVFMSENATSVQSAFLEVNGITLTAGTNNIQVQVNSQAIKTYVINSNETSFKIYYKVDAANLSIDPQTNTFYITPSLATNITSAKIVVSYAYTP